MYQKICTITLAMLLTACGTVGSFENPEETGYVMVSKGNASLLYSIFAGKVDYCKATQHNLKGVEFVGEIEYDGDNCRVIVQAEDNNAVY